MMMMMMIVDVAMGHIPRSTESIYSYTYVCIYVVQKAKNNTQNTREIIGAGEAWSQNSPMKADDIAKTKKGKLFSMFYCFSTCLQQRIECPLLASALLYVRLFLPSAEKDEAK